MLVRSIKATAPLFLALIIGGMVGAPLRAQSRDQFNACLNAVSQRFRASRNDIKVNPGPIRNGNSVIMWQTSAQGGMNGYCEVTPGNQIVNLDRGPYKGNAYGGGNGYRPGSGGPGSGGDRIPDAAAISACQNEAARRTNTDMRGVRATIANNSGYQASVNWRTNNRAGSCTVDRSLRVVDFRDSGGGFGPGGPGNGRGGPGFGPGPGYGNGGGQPFQAVIKPGGGDGKCTFEVEVDQVAEVEIRGTQGFLRTVSGSPATWRRLVCNRPLPPNPQNFRFKGIDGRGSQDLLRNPNNNGGTAVIRLNDPKSGREGYTGDIIWR